MNKSLKALLAAGITLTLLMAQDVPAFAQDSSSNNPRTIYPYCVENDIGNGQSDSFMWNYDHACNYPPGYTNFPLTSPNGRYRLIFQGDGNLVEYGPSGAVWNTQTNGKGATRLSFQTDGNTVIYNGNNPLWASGVSYRTQSSLQLQDDSNLVHYSWSGAGYGDTNNKYSLWSSQYGFRFTTAY